MALVGGDEGEAPDERDGDLVAPGDVEDVVGEPTQRERDE
jgi:hypothetical protein